MGGACICRQYRCSRALHDFEAASSCNAVGAVRGSLWPAALQQVAQLRMQTEHCTSQRGRLLPDIVAAAAHADSHRGDVGIIFSEVQCIPSFLHQVLIFPGSC